MRYKVGDVVMFTHEPDVAAQITAIFEDRYEYLFIAHPDCRGNKHECLFSYVEHATMLVPGVPEPETELDGSFLEELNKIF